MARARTAQTIIDEARELADKVNDPHVSDATALRWASQALAELWEMLVIADPLRQIQDTVITVTDPSTHEYVLPDDFMSIEAVDFERGGNRYPVEPFEFHERRFGTLNSQTSSWGTPTARYRVMRQGVDGTETRLVWDADPGAGTYRVWYVPAPPTLLVAGDTFDGTAGWEDWVVNEVAINMLGKEESDPSWLMAKQVRIKSRIESNATRRDHRPRQIQDTYSREQGRGGPWMR